jgi:single-strand DNA-binding protein
MANLNKVMLIGRLTRDPEVRTFSNGGKVANFGFAVNNRKKNQTTGEWEEEPCFLDLKAFNRETGRKLADLVEQYLHKGNLAYIEGHLVFEQWEDKNGGGKRQAVKIVVDDVQFLEPRADGGGMREGAAKAPRPAAVPPRRQEASYSGGGSRYDDEPMDEPPSRGGAEDGGDIPF